MTKRKEQFRLDLKLCLGESLFEGHGLSKIERLLSKAEQWGSELCIWREDEKKRRRVENFTTDVQKAATDRGALFDELVKEHGAGPYARRTGSVELRGADDALIVVLNLDDYRFAPSAGRWLWGNTLTVQLCEPRIGEHDAIDVARRIADRACAELSPWYAHGQLIEEWEQKNISREGGGMRAVGVDASRYLSGLYWVNFFGEPYCTLIGKERLVSAPAHQTEEKDGGVLLYLAATPEAWNTPEYETTEKRVLAHLGDKYFFSPHMPHRETVAPDFGLESLPRNPRFT